ncbi:hypothetical protein PoB_007667000 [Plakobranchus ocellatus]|uniref:Uncharacterized protein n=1 Tax=Plakobranchus ocellatus TaxID=259542 RepID=A0AAV4E1K9_9GAST|nr:hypothetical protein PoB_007667000 [Plakobranchus ocellatus]
MRAVKGDHHQANILKATNPGQLEAVEDGFILRLESNEWSNKNLNSNYVFNKYLKRPNLSQDIGCINGHRVAGERHGVEPRKIFASSLFSQLTASYVEFFKY